MKKYYSAIAKYATTEEKRILAEKVQLPKFVDIVDELDELNPPVNIERCNAMADLLWKHLSGK